jgi:hypothetical protein
MTSRAFPGLRPAAIAIFGVALFPISAGAVTMGATAQSGRQTRSGWFRGARPGPY